MSYTFFYLKKLVPTLIVGLSRQDQTDATIESTPLFLSTQTMTLINKLSGTFKMMK